MSFDEFYRETFTPLKRYVLRIGARVDEAEDVVQEVMAQAMRGWSTIQSPKAWCYRAAYTELIKVKRRRKQEDEVLQALGRPEPAPGPQLGEEIETVRRCLELLPPAQRQVLALIFDGYKATEIAQLLDKHPDTVRANLREARRRLRRLLEGEA